MIQRVLSAVLESHGAIVSLASSAEEALETFDPGLLDVLITDISMPGLSGIDLLRAIRKRDSDLPVLIMTGRPEVETAAAAVELNATRYLAKPVQASVMWDAVTSAGHLRRLARIKRDLQDAAEASNTVGDLGTLNLHFEDALAKIKIHFQPIVDLDAQRAVAYEVLCRSGSEHIPYPDQLFGAADRLGRVVELGRAIRKIACARICELPPSVSMFVNLHPTELTDDDLLDPVNGLAAFADRIVLEVTERETLDSVDDAAGRIAMLKEAGFRVAVDDLGAGYAGLASFVQLDPDVVKVDMSLVRDVHLSPTKQRLISSLVSLCAEMGTHVVVEGVETPEERDALIGAGCNWMQGYFFGRPTHDPQTPKF